MSDALRQLLRAVAIRSPMEYELAGRVHKVAAFQSAQPSIWSAYSAGQPPLVLDLQGRIYEDAYCRPLGVGQALSLSRQAESLSYTSGQAESPSYTTSLIDALSAANAGRDRWESGWHLAQLMQNGHAMAHKGELSATFAPGEFTPAHGGGAVPGAPLHVLFARESRTQQPGFYYANGAVPPPAGSDSRMTRIYFHISENGAVPLVKAVTTLLNRYELPFRFKTLSYGGAYTRADAAVLFFATRYHQLITRILPAIRAEIANDLRPAIPLLSLRLHDGIGLAEDPANGESFGMNRSRLIAQAIWDAYARGMQSEESRMQELAIQFQRSGLSLDRPHLRAASADIYEAAA